jgi:hydrogenase expression/formation protein HypE
VSDDLILLGLNPLYLANEGKLLALMAPEATGRALQLLRGHPLGRARPSSAR